MALFNFHFEFTETLLTLHRPLSMPFPDISAFIFLFSYFLRVSGLRAFFLHLLHSQFVYICNSSLPHGYHTSSMPSTIKKTSHRSTEYLAKKRSKIEHKNDERKHSKKKNKKKFAESESYEEEGKMVKFAGAN